MCANFRFLLLPAGLVRCSLNRAANFQIDTYSNPIPEGAIMVQLLTALWAVIWACWGRGGMRAKGGGTFLEQRADDGKNQHCNTPSPVCKVIRLL